MTRQAHKFALDSVINKSQRGDKTHPGMLTISTWYLPLWGEARGAYEVMSVPRKVKCQCL